MLKRFVILSVLVFVLGVSYVGCGGSDDDGGAGYSEAKCESLCDKGKDCDENYDKDECVAQCKDMGEKLTSSAFNDLYECVSDLSGDDICDDTKVSACMVSMAAKCPEGNANEYYRAYCTKMIDCNGADMSVDECVSQMEGFAGSTGDIINCVKDSAISDLKSCLNSASCEEYSDSCQLFDY